jgi:hypothetical protein
MKWRFSRSVNLVSLHLPVVSGMLQHTVTVIGKIKLRPYEQDLAIENDNAAVVSVVAMHDG